MFRALSDRASGLVFVVLVLAVSLGTARVAGGLNLAFSPLLVVLLMMLVVTREGWSRAGWRRLGLGRAAVRSWPVAIATTAGVSVPAAAGVVLLGFARFTTPHGPWLTDLLAMCVAGPVLAFAEEIGWRGYLQPRLRSSLAVGAVWIAWHLPYILLTPDYHADGNRVVVLTLFSGSVLAFSVLFGALREQTGSMWPAVLAHFAHNATFALLASYALETSHPVLVHEYLAGDTGLLVLIGTAVFAVIVTQRAGLGGAHAGLGDRRDGLVSRRTGRG
ncbi:CPBP family intramembrane metalloprotease [Actinoplanes bogorensis]|uniref:CPBP family intramembrane metalloprotease n=1 Tax=Paractinoplanes bogorensis TaxID=1610840 RepID=A0ABS5YWW5_9ACTN|nr:CPBP family intramembrane glutamic endopeptidase [Actinoplanes bogorensis]MBU2667933.1 CPBP family intramembrane metalloprotease [Actinoplanes bogorensis]